MSVSSRELLTYPNDITDEGYLRASARRGHSLDAEVSVDHISAYGSSGLAGPRAGEHSSSSFGKWGQHQRKCVVDTRLQRVVEECVNLPGYEVFKYRDESGKVRDIKARDLNVYVKEVVGEEFTPKDFRTWAGTLIAAVTVAELGTATEFRQSQKIVLEAVDAVAQRLGNTRDIARASCISPRVLDHFMEGSMVAYYGERMEGVIAAEQGELTGAERALLDLLKRKLRRELEKAA